MDSAHVAQYSNQQQTVIAEQTRKRTEAFLKRNLDGNFQNKISTSTSNLLICSYKLSM
jgi:hypothetical protein